VADASLVVKRFVSLFQLVFFVVLASAAIAVTHAASAVIQSVTTVATITEQLYHP
jgi:hypothetical protein